MAAAHCPACDKPYADRTGTDPCPRCGANPKTPSRRLVASERGDPGGRLVELEARCSRLTVILIGTLGLAAIGFAVGLGGLLFARSAHASADQVDRALQDLRVELSSRPVEHPATSAPTGAPTPPASSLSSASRVIEARGFVVVDADGTRRGALELRDDGSCGVKLFRPDGTVAASLFSGKDNPGVSLMDARGKFRAGMLLSRDGQPNFQLADKKETTRLVLEVGPDDTPMVKLGNSQDKTRVSLFASDEGAGMSLNANDGTARVDLDFVDKFGAFLSLNERDSRDPAVSLHADSGASSFTIGHKLTAGSPVNLTVDAMGFALLGMSTDVAQKRHHAEVMIGTSESGPLIGLQDSAGRTLFSKP